jgi:hypothetical protein
VVQTPAIVALPPVGPLLGAAYDRGVTTLIRSWRIVVILLAVECLVASVPSIARSSFENILLFGWNFYAMANAIRLVFDPEYRMSNRTAGDMFGALIMTGVLFVLVNIVGIIALVQPIRTGVTWLICTPGAVVGIWLYVKFKCGPAIAAQGTPAIKALGESWRLTSNAFWQTLIFPATTVAINIALPFLISSAAGVLLIRNDSDFLATAISVAVAVLIFLGEIYVAQSSDIAICMWLKALQYARPVESELLEPTLI